MGAFLVGSIGYSLTSMMTIMGGAGVSVVFKRLDTATARETLANVVTTIAFFVLAFGAASATYLVLR